MVCAIGDDVRVLRARLSVCMGAGGMSPRKKITGQHEVHFVPFVYDMISRPVSQPSSSSLGRGSRPSRTGVALIFVGGQNGGKMKTSGISVCVSRLRFPRSLASRGEMEMG